MIGYEQTPRYAELVRRVWGEDSEILPPGIILELDRPEWKIHKRELDWTTGQLSIAPAPANNGRFQISNALGSNRLVVVEKMALITTAVGIVICTVDGPAAATPAPCLALDTRPPFAAGPGAPTVSTISLIANNNAVIGGYRVAFFSTSAGVPVQMVLPKPVVLSPGHNFTVYDNAVNEQLQGFIYGYERPAEPEELTP